MQYKPTIMEMGTVHPANQLHWYRQPQSQEHARHTEIHKR